MRGDVYSAVMFNQGGRPSTERRRDVDLYIYVDNVDAIHHELKERKASL
jgi:hypothetical protein